MKFTKLLSLAAVAMLPSLTAAQTIDLKGLNPQWKNDVPDAGVSRQNPVPFSDVRVCWPGKGNTDKECEFLEINTESGYRFQRTVLPSPVSSGVPFSLGTLTHYNRSTTANPLDKVDLEFFLEFDGSPVFFYAYRFDHTEGLSTNDVTMTLLGAPDRSFFLPFPVEWNLTVLGFGSGPASISNSLSTPENAIRSTQLWAQVTTVPEPSSLALVAAGLVGVVAASRRRRTA